MYQQIRAVTVAKPNVLQYIQIYKQVTGNLLY